MTEFAFDPLTGSMLVGQKAMDLHLQRGGTFLPLPGLITARYFPYESQEFVHHPRRWSSEELISHGRWTLSLVQKVDASLTLRTGHLQRVAALGLGPGKATIQRGFGVFRNFQRQVGAQVRNTGGQYLKWGRNDFFAYATDLHEEVAKREGAPRKLTPADIYDRYVAERGPSENDIKKRGGGISNLNDFLGYPDVRRWDRDDFIAWGARLLRANGGWINDIKFALNTLSPLKRGPSDAAVQRNVGRLTVFRGEAAQELARQEAARRNRLDWCQQMITKGELDETLVDQPAVLLREGAKLRIWQHFERHLSNKTRQVTLRTKDSDSFIRSVARAGPPWLTPGRVEQAAIVLDLYDDLWPVNDDHLRLS